jgi:hypothetical protein
LLCRISSERVKILFYFFIDCTYAWSVDGLAFFSRKTIKAGRIYSFDDIDWIIDREMPEDIKKETPMAERKTAQIGKGFSLLVKRHPYFTNIKDDGCWGWAHKKIF